MTSDPLLKLRIKNLRPVKKFLKTLWYSRFRQNLPVRLQSVVDDSGQANDADVIHIDWPAHIKKPRFGIVQDYEEVPRWTKYRRFLRNNAFEHSIYDIHAHDWLESAKRYDAVVGVCSCDPWHLQEVREKFYFLERFLGVRTYPSAHEVLLFEDKKLEAYIARAAGIPFANTLISYSRDDAMARIQKLKYPVVSKVVPSSGSVGVEMVKNTVEATRIINQVFSRNGRKSHLNYFRQKNFIYFQEFIPNDGYDIRVMAVGNSVFGYYRKVPAGDFRASGMGMVEKRALPEKAMEIALTLRKVVKSPMLVVDLVHAFTGEFVVIEYSPVCKIETPEQLHVRDVPGAYQWTAETGFRFQPCRPWLHELALREFLLHTFLDGETPQTNLDDPAQV